MRPILGGELLGSTFLLQLIRKLGRRRCLAAGVLDIWHGTDHEGTARIHQILARHGTGRPCTIYHW